MRTKKVSKAMKFAHDNKRAFFQNRCKTDPFSDTAASGGAAWFPALSTNSTAVCSDMIQELQSGGARTEGRNEFDHIVSPATVSARPLAAPGFLHVACKESRQAANLERKIESASRALPVPAGRRIRRVI